VAHDNDKVYEFAPLEEYSLKQRISIRAADLIFFAAIRLIGLATRIETEGREHLETFENNGHIPIYVFWHDRIFLSTYYWRKRKIVVMTSKSFDGEYIARFIQRFGYGAIRGSSSRGGAKALVEMIKAMRSGLPMAFTIDGPRGPRYETKPGPIILAKKTGNPILPFVVEPRSFWTTRSWDAMQIPKPFTRAKMIIGAPIYVPDDADDTMIESKTRELQASLDDLVRRGKNWREAGD
jgi:lysophospholipid acyltransferase (LPLAT)-like uncharacterized protein